MKIALVCLAFAVCGNMATEPTGIEPLSARKVVTVTVSPDSMTLQVGDIARATCTPRNQSGTALTNACNWASRDTAVAGVTGSQSASITARTLGRTWAVAVASGKRDSVCVLVTTTGVAMPCVDLSSPTPTEPPPPGGEPTGTRTVNVATSAQLSTALAGARPGDLIVLAPGTYAGRFTATASGTATQRITLYGPRTAILRGNDLLGTELYLNGADYWTLQGFTVQRSLAGVALKNGASNNIVDSLDVSGQGQANIVVKQNSSNNVIRNNQVHGGGVTTAQFGEGIYIGTTEAQWVNGIADHSDNNEVSGNNIYNTPADCIQFMAGTTGTIVRGNTLDGAGLVFVAEAPPFWVLAMGNNGLIEDNVGTNANTHGMQLHRSTTAPTWGLGNVFRKNTMNVGSASYYAIYMASSLSTNVVYCDNGSANANDRTDAGSLTNITCTA